MYIQQQRIMFEYLSNARQEYLIFDDVCGT